MDMFLWEKKSDIFALKIFLIFSNKYITGERNFIFYNLNTHIF